MEHYPVVIGQRLDYPSNTDLALKLAEFAPQSSIHTVLGSTFTGTMLAAMKYADLHLRAPWFWYVDSRYDIAVHLCDWLAPHPKAITAYKTLPSYGDTTFMKDDPLAEHAGVYFLPSLRTARSSKVSYINEHGGIENGGQVQYIGDGIGSWPHMKSDFVIAKKAFPYSTFVLRYDEPEWVTQDLLAATKTRLSPLDLRRVDTQMSIYSSHAHLASESKSEMFYVFDADFRFYDAKMPSTFPVDVWADEKRFVHVWYAENPINGLVYGHGGPKMFNRAHFLTVPQKSVVDTAMTVGEGLVVHGEPVGYHGFDWSAFSTWRTALREAAKLSKMDDIASKERLKAWTTKADGNHQFAKQCLNGANTGVYLANQSVNVEWVNDFTYLKKLFKEQENAIT